jgi:hypothetical protein
MEETQHVSGETHIPQRERGAIPPPLQRVGQEHVPKTQLKNNAYLGCAQGGQDDVTLEKNGWLPLAS